MSLMTQMRILARFKGRKYRGRANLCMLLNFMATNMGVDASIADVLRALRLLTSDDKNAQRNHQPRPTHQVATRPTGVMPPPASRVVARER